MSNLADFDERKIFVGGLNRDTGDEALRGFYKQWGEVADVFISKDLSTGLSRGFGFVTFASKQSVEDCLAHLPHEIDGKVVDAKKAIPRTPKGVGMAAPPIPTNSVPQEKKIFIGGVPINATTEDLQQYFSQFGPVEEVDLLVDRATGKRRGFGFVSFSYMETVEKLCALHFVEINGKKVEVKQAQARPGFGGGRGRGGPVMMGGRGRGTHGRGGGFTGRDFGFGGPPGPYGRGHPGPYQEPHGPPHPGNYGQMNQGPVPVGHIGGGVLYGAQGSAQPANFVGGASGGSYGPGAGGSFAAGTSGSYGPGINGSHAGGQPVQGNSFVNQVNAQAGGYQQPAPNVNQLTAYGQSASGYGYGQPAGNAAAAPAAAPSASGYVGQAGQGTPQPQYGTTPATMSYGQPSTGGYGTQAVGATTAYSGHAAASGTPAAYGSDQSLRGSDSQAIAASSLQGQVSARPGYGSAATGAYSAANSGYVAQQGQTATAAAGYTYVPGVGYQQQPYAAQAANKAYGMTGAVQASGAVPPSATVSAAGGTTTTGYHSQELGSSYQQTPSSYNPQRPATNQVANHGYAPY